MFKNIPRNMLFGIGIKRNGYIVYCHIEVAGWKTRVRIRTTREALEELREQVYG